MRKLMLVFLFAISVVNAQQVIDKVVAIVDSEIITKSEYEISVLRFAAQKNLDPKDEAIRKEVLNALIDEKLMYAQAELDSIVVTDAEVDRRLEQTINYFVQQYGTQEAIEKAFGMSIEKIRREIREDNRKALMTERVKEKKFARIDVSAREVNEFFNSFADSLGLIPERYKVAHIFLNPKANDRVKNKTKIYAESILDSLKKGADFAELAKKLSDDPGSAARGGDLGWAKRGKFFSEFESAAFALRDNEMSKVIESPVGYHIIQLLGRRGESIHTRHILFKIKSDDQTELEAIEFLSEIKDSIEKKINTFGYFAQKYSNDKQTAPFGGELGTFEISQLDNQLKDVVFKLKEGQISPPKRIQMDAMNFGYHIVKLIKKTTEHKPTLEDDFEDIKRVAQVQKEQRLYKDWLQDLRSKIFWEIKD